jgi:hypothetical protein
MGFYPFVPLVPPGAAIATALAGQTVPGSLAVNGAFSTSSFNNISASGGLFAAFGNVDIQTAGEGLRVREGTNAKQGTSVLTGGTVAVANTSVTASSIIIVGQNTPGGTPGAPYVSSVTPGTGFTITSTTALDTSTVGWEIFEPG